MTVIYIMIGRRETYKGYDMVVYREVTGAPSSKPAKICKVLCALCSQEYVKQYNCYQHCVKYHRQTDNANELSEDSGSEPEHNAADDEQQKKLADEVEAEHLRDVEAKAEEERQRIISAELEAERQRIIASELEAEQQRKLANAAKQRQIALEIAAEEAEQQRQLAEIDAEYQLKMSIRQAEAERKQSDERAILHQKRLYIEDIERRRKEKEAIAEQNALRLAAYREEQKRQTSNKQFAEIIRAMKLEKLRCTLQQRL